MNDTIDKLFTARKSRYDLRSRILFLLSDALCFVFGSRFKIATIWLFEEQWSKVFSFVGNSFCPSTARLIKQVPLHPANLLHLPISPACILDIMAKSKSLIFGNFVFHDSVDEFGMGDFVSAYCRERQAANAEKLNSEYRKLLRK